MGKPKVFLDSDVIISSLLSNKGASFLILENGDVDKIISEVIKKEVEEVSIRLDILLDDVDIFKHLEIVSLGKDKGKLAGDYIQYVMDAQDSHVVSGAKRANVRFLLTHNTKHYNEEKIKRDLGILVMKPGIFLQYLRSS